MSSTSRRILATLALSLLLTPSLVLARPQARKPQARVATAQPGLIDLLHAGLTQLMAKLVPIGPPVPPAPAPGGGAGVRIDPEGHS